MIIPLLFPKQYRIRSDPENKRDGYSSVVSYWGVALNEAWKKVNNLQKKFGNLSNESITVITSLSEIVNPGSKFAFGHDKPIQEFFLSYGLDLTKKNSLD